jgi:FAD/FMN-containing dehydrogenase
MSSQSTVLDELASTFGGTLLKPGEAGYDDARKVHNGLIDKRPSIIAQCRGAADIADAIRLGRALGVEIAIRGGGHNPAGRASTNGGVMIDLSLMRGVLVDAQQRIARVQGGALWKDVNRETQAHGLAVTGGAVGTTGVAGLTLGGGLGWLMAKHGMTLDNLRSVDLVLADGRLVRASEAEHSDLFWAVRGGGGNFGVASAFEFQLHPVGPTVVGGLAAWPFDRARDVLRFYRERTRSASDDEMLFAAMLTAPDGVTKLVAIAAAHLGSAEAAQAAMKPIKSFGSPVLDTLGPIPYVALNGMLDAAFPKGALNYWKSHFIDTLTDDAIDTAIDQFSRCPTPMGQFLFEHFHGAATRVPVDATAYALRSEGFNTAVISEWLDPAQSQVCTAWARDAYAALQPFVGSRRYVNYLDDDDIVDASLTAVYGPNLPRLRQIKRVYDPDNVFRLNLNIPPQ